MPGSQPDTTTAEAAAVSGTNDATTVDQGHNDGFRETTPPAEAPAGTETGADTAKSPGADGADDQPKTLLEATRRVLEQGDSPAPDGENTDQPKPTDAAKPAEGEADASKTDAEKEPPFHQHPRWQEKIRQERTLKAEVAALEPDARSHREILGFMETNSLTAEDVRSGFAIMAALRNDPAKAWELLQPTIKSVREFLGHDLPPDLAARVEEGAVDEATARETARLRNERSLNDRVATENRSRAAAREAQTEAATASAAVGGAVDAWINSQAGTDPDYSHVQPLLEGEILRLQREATQAKRPFNTPELAVAMVTTAYGNVKERLTRARPAPRPMAPTPRSSAPSAAPATAPKTLQDAIRAAVR